MSVERKEIFCRYHYDPLDRLVGRAPARQESLQCFYNKSQLVTEIQAQVQHSFFQSDGQLLAQIWGDVEGVETLLLATNQGQSVVQALNAEESQRLIYTVYGHLSAKNGQVSLLAFNGERPDPVTHHYLLGNGYRAFNPVLMRFNSPDSYSPFGRGGLNPYVYCLGDPVNLGDSNGHSPQKFLKRIWNRVKSSVSRKSMADDVGALSGNKHFISGAVTDYSGDIINPLSLRDLAMHKAEKMINATPGGEIESLLKGRFGASVKAWDNKTGMTNIAKHSYYSYRNASTYDVISAGINGELYGVLPARAQEYSLSIIANSQSRSLHLVHPPGSSRATAVNIAAQREIYRQAGVPIPAFLKDDAIGEQVQRIRK